MTPQELAAVRARLEAFAAQLFAPLPRTDQRAKGATYVRGLLLDGRRKSMQPMAARHGVDHQGLQQFVASSTRDVEVVRARLARRAVEVIAPNAWVVDDTDFAKDGTASPGVARQYSGRRAAARLAEDGSLPQAWLLAEWPPEAAEPTGYWLSNLPADTPPADLVRLGEQRWRVEHDYRELKTGLGLDHFEGRTLAG